MEILKTYLFFEGHDEGHPHLVDTIFYENQWWLVSTWIEANNKSEKFPDRLVLLTGLRFQEVENERYRFILNNAIPKSVFDGEEKEGYTIAYFPVLENIQTPQCVH